MSVGPALGRLRRALVGGFYLIAVLLILDRTGPCYGYRIMRIMREAGGALDPSESTVYTVLRKLEGDRLVRSYWALSEGNVPRRYYEITEEGRGLLREALSLVDSLFEALSRLRGAGA